MSVVKYGFEIWMLLKAEEDLLMFSKRIVKG